MKDEDFELILIATGVLLLCYLLTQPHMAYAAKKKTTGATVKTPTPSTKAVSAPISAVSTPTSLIFPAGVVQGAMCDENCHEDGNGQLVKAFNALVKKPIGVCYFTDNWYSGINFPADKCASIKAAGAVPFIRMQIWQKEGDQLSDLGPYTHRNIAAGKHDAALTKYAQAAKAHGTLILIQYCVEVNGNWFPWFKEGPAAYKAACQHVINLFRKVGATNVKWGFQVDATDNNNGARWYPGDAYIDLIGTSCYGAKGYGQKGMASELAKCWVAFSTISLTKPLAIFEWGQAMASDNTSALSTVATNPLYNRIKLMMYWNEKLCDPKDPVPPDGRVNANAASLAAYQKGIASGRFTSQQPSVH